MTKFLLDTDVISGTKDKIGNLTNDLSDVKDNVSSLDFSDASEFNFNSAIKSIESNIDGASEKINNTVTYLNKVLETHTNIQNTLKFEKKEFSESVEYSNIDLLAKSALAELPKTSNKKVEVMEKSDNDSSKTKNINSTLIDNNVIRNSFSLNNNNDNLKGTNQIIANASILGGTTGIITKSSNNNEISKNKSVQEPKEKNNNIISTADKKIEVTPVPEVKMPASTETREIVIPTEYGNSGFFSYTTINRKWTAGTAQKKVDEIWKANGSQSKDSIAVIDGRYLIACTSTYGKVGDYIDFYLEDGTVIPTIMMDEKSQKSVSWDRNPANEWGHDGGQQIVEFEITRVVNNTGNVGTWAGGWAGKRVSGATNLGTNIING